MPGYFLQLDIWKVSKGVHQSVDIMASGESATRLLRLFEEHSVPHSVMISDVEKWGQGSDQTHRLIVAREARRTTSANDLVTALFRPFFKRDSTSGSNATAVSFPGLGTALQYPFGEYTDYSRMVQYMRRLEGEFPGLVKTFNLGSTHEGREIIGIKVLWVGEKK